MPDSNKTKKELIKELTKLRRQISKLEKSEAERKLAEEALRENEERLAEINECLLSLGTNYNSNVEQLTALCGKLLGATCALYNRLEGDMLCSLGQWQTPPDYEPKDRSDGHICYDVIQKGGRDAFVIRNLPESTYAKTDPNVTKYALKTYVGQAVKCGNEVVGSLCAVFQTDIDPTKSDKRVLGIIASALGAEEDRKQAEKELRKNKEELQTIFDSVPSIIWYKDKENRIIRVNKAAAKSVSLSVEDIEGKTAFELFPEYAEKYFKDDLEVINSGKPKLGIIEPMKIPSGETRWVKTDKVPYRDDHGNIIGVIAFVVDITERKQAEEKLYENEKKLKDIINHSNEVFYIHDAKHQLSYVSPYSKEVFGYNPDEMMVKWTTLVTDNPINEEGFKLREKTVKTGEKQKPYILEIKRKDGKLRFIEIDESPIKDENGKVIAITGALRDITERKRAEEALEDSEERLKILFEFAPHAIYLTDLKGTFIQGNRAAEVTSGYKRDELIGKNFLQLKLLSPKEMPKAAKNLAKNAIGMPTGPHEFTFNRKDGKQVRLKISTYPVKIKGQTLVLGIARDITKRKQAAAALQASEGRYRILVENASDGIVVVQNGWLKFVNSRVMKIIKYTQEELLSTPFIEFVHPDDREKAVEINRKRINGKDTPEVYDLRAIDKEGTLKWLEIGGVQITWEGKPASLNFVKNITDRKQAEMALQDSENKLLEAQRIAQLGHYTLNIKTGYWISSVELDNIFGIDEDYKKDVACWQQIVHPDYRDTMSNYFQDDVLGQHRKFDKEYKVVDATTGQEKWVHGLGSLKFDEDGNPVEMFGTIQDITERKKAEEANAQLSRAIEQADETIVITDTEGTIQYVNPAFEKTTGYTVKEAIGQNPKILKSGEHDDAFYKRMWETLTSGKEWRGEIINKKKDGTIFIENATISPVFDSHGKIVNYVAAKNDITETKRLQELESRAARLETAGTIAGQVAHDFNNLLAPIMAYPEFIRNELPHDHKAHAFLDDIESAAEKIADINQDLLTMGRRGHYTLDIINLNRIVLHAVKEMESLTDTVTYETDLCKYLMSMKGGDAQIHRILINLLVNAQDAMDDIGQVTIKTENYYADDTSIAFGRVPKGEYVKLTITDTGYGIPDDIIQKVLDPFFTTKTTDKKRGSGLGLSVVDAVMKDHNGHLDLSSKVGHGTSFYLYFPVTRKDTGEDESEHLAAGTEKVLVVDDDDIQREVSSQLLTKLGYRVSSVESGEKAIEFLRKNQQDIVILDMVMPGGIDGAETYRRILEISPHQKAIIISGFSESDRVLEAQKLGAGAFIRKPVTKSVIAAAVRTELNRRVETLTS